VAKQKAEAVVDAGLAFFPSRATKGWTWHIARRHIAPESDAAESICDTKSTGIFSVHAVPKGERICRRCLLKLQKAIGGDYQIKGVK